MEEKALTGGQKDQKTEQPKQKQISYEDLRHIAAQLKQQNDELIRQNQELVVQLNNAGNVERRLYYLFEVLKYNSCFDEDWIKSIVNEIKDIITIPEQKEEEGPAKE